ACLHGGRCRGEPESLVNSITYNPRARLVAAISSSPVMQRVLVGLLAVSIGIAGGAGVAFGPFWAGFVILAALALAYAMLVHAEVGLAIVFFVSTVLPFGTLPFKAVITPNFLELALLALL